MICFPKAERPSDQLLKILETSGILRRNVPKNTVLFREGEENNEIFILEKGYIQVAKMDAEGKVKLLALGHEQVFGVSGFFKRKEYPATVTTLTNCTLYCLQRQEVTYLMRKNPIMVHYFLETMDEFVSFYISNSVRQSYASLEMKLAGLLLDMTEEVGERIPGGELLIPLAISNETLGNFLGTSRETISRVIGKWKGNGWLYKKRRYIVIHDINSLKKNGENE